MHLAARFHQGILLPDCLRPLPERCGLAYPFWHPVEAGTSQSAIYPSAPAMLKCAHLSHCFPLAGGCSSCPDQGRPAETLPCAANQVRPPPWLQVLQVSPRGGPGVRGTLVIRARQAFVSLP